MNVPMVLGDRKNRRNPTLLYRQMFKEIRTTGFSENPPYREHFIIKNGKRNRYVHKSSSLLLKRNGADSIGLFHKVEFYK